MMNAAGKIESRYATPRTFAALAAVRAAREAKEPEYKRHEELIKSHTHLEIDHNKLREQRDELLAACQMVTKACGHHSNWNGETRDFLIACEKAIANAEPA
jgi:hypothetical protein